MCDCVPSTLLAYSGIRIRKLGFTGCNWGPRNEPIREVDTINSSNVCNSEVTRVKDGGLRHIRGSFKPTGCEIKRLKSMNCLRVSRNPGMLGSDECEFYGELGFKEKGEKHLEFETSQNDAALENSTMEIKEDCESSDAWASSSSDFVELKDVLESEKRSTTSKGSLKDEDLVRIEGSDGVGSKLDEPVQFNGRPGLRNGRQVMRRSNMLAKQVISMESALSLGFVSQLWVNTYSWVVLVVEVRPNLLSGELERFLLEDVSQVGDVVLIQDERVMENEFKMVGLETLVGYKVVTPGRRNIGKVRGYTFNINSGAVESLELDSFGISIIPSSLVSTYALCVEDVLEVVSDTVVVHEAAASRIQKLTKGFWDTGNVKTSIDEFGEYSDLARQPVRSDSRSSGQKFRPKMRKTEDDWELPMDYL